jgi:hypothetical protein
MNLASVQITTHYQPKSVTTVATEPYRGKTWQIVNQLDPMWANIIFLSELSPEEIVDLQVELEECQDVWGDVLELTNSALLQK